MVVTDNNVLKLEMLVLLILFLESNINKSNAGLLKQMRRYLRNNSFFFIWPKRLGFL